jgi:ribosomal protein L11 methyltransferase
VSVEIPAARAEEARAQMIELFPEGFQEIERADGVELVAYTDPGGEERLWMAFGHASGSDVADDWEDRWREFHRPVRIGPLWIGQPWQEPPLDALAVVIEPGRAFGTGAHPTTKLCLELLVELPRGSVVDVGCGSGVLAIAAAKLGFGPVVAVDVDEHAVEATVRNAEANAVVVSVRRCDVLTELVPEADLGIFNVTREVLEAAALRLNCRRLLASGYLAAQAPALAGFRHVERAAEAGWVADVFER